MVWFELFQGQMVTSDMLALPRGLSDGLGLPQLQLYQRRFANVPISAAQHGKCLMLFTTCCNSAGAPQAGEQNGGATQYLWEGCRALTS